MKSRVNFKRCHHQIFIDFYIKGNFNEFRDGFLNNRMPVGQSDINAIDFTLLLPYFTMQTSIFQYNDKYVFLINDN